MIHPSVAERRLTLRLLAYWEKMRKDRPMPAESDIDPTDIEDLWDNCLLIHVQDLGKDDYNYTYVGQAIVDAYRGGLSDEDTEGMTSINAGVLASGYNKVIETGKPLLDEGEFLNARQDVVRYRQCLLPLGEEGRVEAIFGGMRFKVFVRQDA